MPAELGDNLHLLIHNALLSVYTTVPEVEMMVRLRLGASLDQLTPPGDLKTRLFKLTEWCIDRSKVQDFVAILYDEHPTNPRVQALYERYFPAAAPSAGGTAEPPVDPFDRYCLGEDSIFVDRKNLRKALRAIESGSGRNVLVVTGGPKTGKTFTYRLIQHGARKYNYQIVSVNLRMEIQPSENQPDILARALLRQMGLDASGIPAQGELNATRWTLDLANWLVGRLRSAQENKKWWILIDGLTRGTTPEAVWLLVTHLAARIEPALPNIRLGLLGYDEPGGLVLTDQNVRFENITRFGQAELEEFFQKAFQERGQPASDDVVKQAAVSVLQAVPRGDPDEMRLLHNTLNEALKRLFAAEAA